MMTILSRASNNQPVSLGKQIASSGEGEVWETNLSGYLAKIYHNPTTERIKKLEVMVANPPIDPMVSRNHISIAWPKELLKDASGSSVGFLMPAISKSRELPSIYNPRLRKRNAPGFNWYYLHATALNTAWIVQAIHAKGYVLGDIKPQNILVNDSALVAVIDTDSFQVRDRLNGQIYRCTVGSEGFTPVELLGKDFSTTDQTEIHDRFRLGVLIHYLLFGYHPFSGQWKGSGDSPEQTELIRRGFWPYGQNSLIHASQNTIPLDVVHPEIKQCFLKCFNNGHTAPLERLTAEDWHNALQVAINELTVCGKVDSHDYSQHYGKCYWCERAAKLGVDIFPAVSSPAVKTTIASSIETAPQTTTGKTACKQTTASQPTQLSTAGTNSLTTTVQPLQVFFKQVQNSQKNWKVIVGLGLGSLAITAALNLASSKNPMTPSTASIPIATPSSVHSANPLVTNSERSSPLSPDADDIRDIVESRVKSEQAIRNIENRVKFEQAKAKALKKEQERQVALEAEQERRAAIKAIEAARAEQARLGATRQERKHQAAIRAEKARQAAIRAEQHRQVAIRAEKARQAAIRAERESQTAIKALEKSQSALLRQQERSANQASNSVNNTRPWASKAPIRSASDDLEDVIRGGKP